jgi:hypothetical protein
MTQFFLSSTETWSQTNQMNCLGHKKKLYSRQMAAIQVIQYQRWVIDLDLTFIFGLERRKK